MTTQRAQPSTQPRRRPRRAISERWAIAAIVVLPFLQWLVYDPKNGMPYETALITTSRARGFFGGFLYIGDPMRPFTSFWYHVGEMLSHVPGMIGSYLGIQIVFLVLWCARNVLFYGVLRRILKLPVSVSFAAAVILSIDASDYAFHWVGQLNQWGMMFFGVASIYFFGRAAQTSGLMRAHRVAVAALLAYMALWSYESEIFILVAVALLLLVVVPKTWAQRVTLLPYFVVPAVWGALTLYHYATTTDTYQSAVTRSDLTPRIAVTDTLWNSGASLSVWNWGAGNVFPGGARAWLVVVASTLIVLVLAIRFGVSERPRDPAVADTATRVGVRGKSALRMVQVGLVLLPLSFPAYVILTSSRQLWRTQFLSGFAAAVVLGGLAYVLCAMLPFRLNVLLPAVLVASICFTGVVAGISNEYAHYRIWQGFRSHIWATVQAMPDLKNNTVVVALDGAYPDGGDPLLHSMWFDLGVQLAYPDRKVAALYYLDDGHQEGPGAALAPLGNVWAGVPGQFATEIANVPIANTVFIRYVDGKAVILRTLPKFATAWWPPGVPYSPESRLGPRHDPTQEVVGRYGPK